MTRRRHLKGGGRYRNPQAWIDHIIATDPALRNVRLTYPPRYSGRLKDYGQARLAIPTRPGYTAIGRASLISRRELLDTIIHEELHHRLERRAQARSLRAWRKTADPVQEEAYVEFIVYRFLRFQNKQHAPRRHTH